MEDYRRSFKLPRTTARYAKGQLPPVHSMALSCPTVLRAQSTLPSVRRASEKNREISTYVAREGLAPGLGMCSRRTRYRAPEFNKSITPVAIPSSKSKKFLSTLSVSAPRGTSGPVPPAPPRGCCPVRPPPRERRLQAKEQKKETGESPRRSLCRAFHAMPCHAIGATFMCPSASKATLCAKTLGLWVTDRKT